MDNFRRLSLYTKEEAALNGKTMDELANLVPVTIKGVYVPILRRLTKTFDLTTAFDDGTTANMAGWRTITDSTSSNSKLCGIWYKDMPITKTWGTTNGSTSYTGAKMIMRSYSSSDPSDNSKLIIYAPNSSSSSYGFTLFLPGFGVPSGNSQTSFNEIDAIATDSVGEGYYYYLDLQNYYMGYDNDHTFHLNVVVSSIVSDNDTYPLYFVI